ncbi:uncharacterized protein V1516DRAFT_669848 [Lipomyces oligophaga]|uniref:uncharacterized protein n=1 Tax=Lipomyces oligophaga TaxID=45792 RepID=UPI0034CDC53A
MSFNNHLVNREQNYVSSRAGLYSSKYFVNQLELTHQLYGHRGCVNALEWSANGRLLASGSDDVHVNIYSTDRPDYPLIHRFHTGHASNIFTLSFMPNTGNSIIVSGSADTTAKVFDLHEGVASLISAFTCFKDCVKKIIPDGSSPSMFLACSEEGIIRHIDLRAPNRYSKTNSQGVLVDYTRPALVPAAFAMAACRPQYFVIGGNRQNLYLHDRRFLMSDIKRSWSMNTCDSDITQCVRKFSPRKKFTHTLTSARFSESNPNELLGSWAGDGIYLFDISSSGSRILDTHSQIMPPDYITTTVLPANSDNYLASLDDNNNMVVLKDESLYTEPSHSAGKAILIFPELFQRSTEEAKCKSVKPRTHQREYDSSDYPEYGQPVYSPYHGPRGRHVGSLEVSNDDEILPGLPDHLADRFAEQFSETFSGYIADLQPGPNLFPRYTADHIDEGFSEEADNFEYFQQGNSMFVSAELREDEMGPLESETERYQFPDVSDGSNIPELQRLLDYIIQDHSGLSTSSNTDNQYNQERESIPTLESALSTSGDIRFSDLEDQEADSYADNIPDSQSNMEDFVMQDIFEEEIPIPGNCQCRYHNLAVFLARLKRRFVYMRNYTETNAYATLARVQMEAQNKIHTPLQSAVHRFLIALSLYCRCCMKYRALECLAVREQFEEFGLRVGNFQEFNSNVSKTLFENFHMQAWDKIYGTKVGEHFRNRLIFDMIEHAFDLKLPYRPVAKDELYTDYVKANFEGLRSFCSKADVLQSPSSSVYMTFELLQRHRTLKPKQKQNRSELLAEIGQLTEYSTEFSLDKMQIRSNIYLEPVWFTHIRAYLRWELEDLLMFAKSHNDYYLEGQGLFAKQESEEFKRHCATIIPGSYALSSSDMEGIKNQMRSFTLCLPYKYPLDRVLEWHDDIKSGREKSKKKTIPSLKHFWTRSDQRDAYIEPIFQTLNEKIALLSYRTNAGEWKIDDVDETQSYFNAPYYPNSDEIRREDQVKDSDSRRRTSVQDIFHAPNSSWRTAPLVFEIRGFHGISNILTVKDVNFYGANDEYIVSGSDSKHLFIWNKKSGALVNVLQGDCAVVNVVESNPVIPQLAVSGIDSTIKIFSPLSIDYKPMAVTRMGKSRVVESRSEIERSRLGYRSVLDSDRFDVCVEEDPVNNASYREPTVSVFEVDPQAVTTFMYPRFSFAKWLDYSYMSDTHAAIRRGLVDENYRAPREFLGPSLNVMTRAPFIMRTNETKNRRGMEESAFSRELLASMARQLRMNGDHDDDSRIGDSDEEDIEEDESEMFLLV